MPAIVLERGRTIIQVACLSPHLLHTKALAEVGDAVVLGVSLLVVDDVGV